MNNKIELIQVGLYKSVQKHKFLMALQNLLSKYGDTEKQVTTSDNKELPDHAGYPLAYLPVLKTEFTFIPCLESTQIKEMYRLLGVKDALPAVGKYEDFACGFPMRDKNQHTQILVVNYDKIYILMFVAFDRDKIDNWQTTYLPYLLSEAYKQYQTHYKEHRQKEIKKGKAIQITKDNKCLGEGVPPIDSEPACGPEPQSDFAKNFIVLKNNKIVN